jgi:orotate phosphoribosyltransferase
MNEQEILQEFADAQAILKGHFILSSGLHSDTYLQCARVLMNPKRADRLCNVLAQKVVEALRSVSESQSGGGAKRGGRPPQIDLVVAPAMGGVVVGYEMGRQLGVDTIFCERENGEFALRRGFAIPKGSNILLVEDVVTTGKSSLEAVECIKMHGGKVIAEASLIDRSGGESKKMPFPLISLLTLDVATFDEKNVPPHLTEVPAVKPGSRWLQKKRN